MYTLQLFLLEGIHNTARKVYFIWHSELTRVKAIGSPPFVYILSNYNLYVCVYVGLLLAAVPDMLLLQFTSCLSSFQTDAQTADQISHYLLVIVESETV